MTDYATFTKTRLTLEDWVNRGVYGHITLEDGMEMDFRPVSVACREDAEGEPLWLSIGLAWDHVTNREQYAWVRLSHVVTLFELPDQPDPID